jgi:ribonucleoside-diphosphate reductase alpha chain
MMDCDTTGIEPDLALVKFKKLVGGGSMQIVNQTVPAALRTLGYQEEQVEAITEYINEHGHVVNAPGLRPDDYPVFDCAMGERTIAPMGHVRMMAAAQPFLSGAISKTVNMPESATIEEIEDTYFQGWKLGLKAIAVYRDNCKVGQVLNVGGKKKGAEKVEPEKVVEYRPTRKRLPKKRPAETVSFSVAGAEGYMIASSYPDDGLGEVFLKMSKQGSTLAGVMDAFSIAISVGLQYGVPLETYVSKFTNAALQAAGMTDPDRMASSVVDYVFRRLALDFLPVGAGPIGIFTAKERTARRLEPRRPARSSTWRRSPRAPRSRPSRRSRRSHPRPSRPARRRLRTRSWLASRSRSRSGPQWSFWRRWRTRNLTRRSASHAAPRCARQVAATSVKAAAPPAVAASPFERGAPRQR